MLVGLVGASGWAVVGRGGLGLVKVVLLQLPLPYGHLLADVAPWESRPPRRRRGMGDMWTVEGSA